MRRAAPLLLLLSFLLCLSGCRVQDAPQPKRRPKEYSKIVSLSPSTTEILTSGLQKYQLAGRTESDNWPTSVSSFPVVASTKPDYEKLAQVKPDLIVLDGDLYSAAEIEKLRSLGAGIFAFKATTLPAFEDELYELASMIGAETAASSYIDKIHIALNAAQATAPANKPKVAVMMPSPSGDHMIDGTESLVADLLRRVGADPIGPQGSTFVKANPETLVSLNPDIIIVNGTKGDSSGVDALLKDPRLQSVNAIKNQRVKAISSDVLLRRGGRVDLLLTGLGRALAP